ncbi:MAG: hypothetical protein QOF51_496 [Chloroflexota bacterium]|jgi:polyisoprenoid-binding protein YceI|nr:hypothetical protein [Chloroflexota bacterium]
MAWRYDLGHSRIGFIVRHFGLTIVHGYFPKADVQLDYHVDDPTKSTMDVTIDAASMTTGNERRDNNTIHEPEYLDADRYPTITFTSTRVEPRGENRYAIVGDFTLRGVTREIVLDTTYAGEATDARGTKVRGLAARTSINKSDYGITGNVIENNVGEMIELEIDVELRDP